MGLNRVIASTARFSPRIMNENDADATLGSDPKKEANYYSRGGALKLLF
jgi:hypothetical protein